MSDIQQSDAFLDYCNFVVDSGPFDGYRAIEHIINSKQDTIVDAKGVGIVYNFCSNNYSGLAGDPRMVEAATEAMHKYGFGLSSTPFVSGYQDIHKQLESKIADFHGTEDSILFASGYHTNAGVFQA